MKKLVLSLICFSMILGSSAFATSDKSCFTCPPGPAGPQGMPGTDGVNGTNGKDGTDGTNGTNGRDGIDGKNAYFDDSKYESGVAGAMAMSRLGHAFKDKMVAGVGIANFESENSIAIGVGKNWNDKISVDVAGFLATEDVTGVAAAINFHF